jgi:hypothetical protein
VGEIRSRRKEIGLNKEVEWDIWRVGSMCLHGVKESWIVANAIHRSAEMITERLVRSTGQIREVQEPYMDSLKPADVVLVWPAHQLLFPRFLVNIHM